MYQDWMNETVMWIVNCGAPRAIDLRGKRRLKRLIRTDRRIIVDQLTVQMNHGIARNISNTTVQRTLASMHAAKGAYSGYQMNGHNNATGHCI